MFHSQNLIMICFSNMEAMLDIANRIIALEEKTPVVTSVEAIKLLMKLEIIRNSELYIKMIQFRNFMVHQYEQVDSAILADICKNHLNDFELFIQEIESHEQ